MSLVDLLYLKQKNISKNINLEFLKYLQIGNNQLFSTGIQYSTNVLN